MMKNMKIPKFNTHLLYSICTIILIFFVTAFSLPDNIEKGIKLFAEGNIFSASIIFKEILAKEPTNTIASFYIAKMTNDGDSATLYFETAKEDTVINTIAEESKLKLGQYYFAKAQYKKSYKYFKFVANNTSVPNWKQKALIGYATTAFILEKYFVADSIYSILQPTLKTPFEKTYALIKRSECALLNKDYGKADTLLTKALTYNCKTLTGTINAKLDTIRNRTNKKPITLSNSNSKNKTDTTKYWIQVGAFGSYKNAEKLKIKFKNQTQKPIGIIIKKREKLHLVWIGPFENKKQATTWKTKNGKKSYRIITTNL